MRIFGYVLFLSCAIILVFGRALTSVVSFDGPLFWLLFIGGVVGVGIIQATMKFPPLEEDEILVYKGAVANAKIVVTNKGVKIGNMINDDRINYPFATIKCVEREGLLSVRINTENTSFKLRFGIGQRNKFLSALAQNGVKIIGEIDENNVKNEETMNQENGAVPAGKLFTNANLLVGSIFGGPLVAGYILYKNFKTLNEHKKASAVIIIIVFVALLAFLVGLLADGIKLPDLVMTFMPVIPFLYTGIAWGIMKKYQGNKIEEHINNGGKLIGWKKTVVIIIFGYIIMAAPFFLLIVVLSHYF